MSDGKKILTEAEHQEAKVGGQAFPKTGNFNPEQGGYFDSVNQDGMTLRDYFAAKTLQGMLANGELQKALVRGDPIDLHKYHAEVAYQFADAMIKERKQ